MPNKIDRQTPNHQDWQKLQVKSWWKKSLGAWACNQAKIPHFSARVKRNFTQSATKNTQKTKSLTEIIAEKH